MNINYDKPTIGKQKTSFFDKISNFGKGIKTKIDDYESDAPERRKRKIAALKQEVQISKLKSQKGKHSMISKVSPVFGGLGEKMGGTGQRVMTRKDRIKNLKEEVQLAKLQQQKKKLMPMEEQSKGDTMNDRINKII